MMERGQRKMARPTSQAVGIDFGTSTTLLARRSATGQAETVPIGRARPWLPSVVGCGADGLLAVGEDAEALPRLDVVRSVKSAITRGDSFVTTSAGVEVDVEDAVKAILVEAVTRGQARGTDARLASTLQMGCPAMWRGPERQLLVRIANECGIPTELGHIVDEPVAAGVAWIEDRLREGGRYPDTKVLVFDPGGGTLDVALLHVRTGEGGTPEITVLSADGIDQSGDSLDAAIAADCARSPELHHLLARDLIARDLLADRARELKELLSIETSGRRPLGGTYEIVVDFDRERLERVFDRQWTAAASLVESVVRGAKLREQQTLSNAQIRALGWGALCDGIGFVVLVGGLSQLPVVAVRLEEMFPAAEVALVKSPQEAIVRGLALGERFERLNLHRPAFNFNLSFFDEHRKQLGGATALYPAFTPVYEPWHTVMMAGDLGYGSKPVTAPARSRQALLHCTTVDGEPLPLQLDGQDLKGIAVAVTPRDTVVFKLYVNGNIIFGPNANVHLRVRSWPTLRGKHHQWRMEVHRVPNRPSAPVIMDEWRFIH